MISYKQLVFSFFLLMFISIGNTFAQTCYDARYGNYNCNQSYYPDAGSAVMEGALIGVVIGGFVNNGNDYEGNNWGGGHGYRGGHGGGGNHRGGGGHGGSGSHGGGHHR